MSKLHENTTDLQSILNTINSLPEAGSGGVELPELSNEGTSADLLSGKQLIDGDGNVVTGTIATKTASNLSANGATVTVPAGYYAAQVTKSVSTVTQATPSISVDSSGLITASATQSAGYVAAGTKSATKQLTIQGAQTITPSTSDQYAVSAGRYTTGDVIVLGDSNLFASNIKKGVDIFGVTGTYEGSGGSGGGDTSAEDGLVTRTLSTYTNSRVTSIGSYAFEYCSRLTTVSFPAVTTIGSYAFCYCSRLTTVSFPAATSIDVYAFYNCYKLGSVFLAGSSVCTLSNSNAFAGTPYTGHSTYFSGTPYIYVPSSLVASYQAATNWTYFSSYFSAIESAGDTGGGDTGDIISFTIEGISYQAKNGMTWGEWVESAYNTRPYILDPENPEDPKWIMDEQCNGCIYLEDYVLSNEIIQANTEYLFETW